MTETKEARRAQRPAPTMSEFVGLRLALARAFQNLTLTKLAEIVSVSFGLLGHYEKGLRRNPREDLVAALASALKVQPGFFFEPLNDRWVEKECSFRRRAATPETIKRRARAHGTLIDLVLRELTTMAKFPKYAIPLSRSETPPLSRAQPTCAARNGALGTVRFLTSAGSRNATASS